MPVSKKAGRPKATDKPDVVSILVTSFHSGMTVREACWQSGISHEAYYSRLRSDGQFGVTKDKRTTPRTIKAGKSSVSKMFHDPFYFGTLVQANQTVDLRTIYDFVPMIDEDTFNQVQLLSQGRTKDKYSTKRVTFYPLHAFVYCYICNSSKHMIVGKNKSGSGHYKLSYRCDNQECTRKPKSMAAHKVFDSIYDRLAKLELTDNAYNLYSKQLDSLTDEKVITIKQEVMSHRGALAHIKKE